MVSLSNRRDEALSDPSIKVTLQSMRAVYESGFAQSSKIESPKHFSIADLPISSDSLVDVGSTFNHREVMGQGDTAKEAMEDWKTRLDKCPQSGDKLMWRVPPEIDCWCDFPSDKLIWKVYARFVIMP